MFKFSKAAKRQNQVDCTANNSLDYLQDLEQYWDEYSKKLKDEIGDANEGMEETIKAMDDIMYHTVEIYRQNIELMREMNKVMLEVDERTKQIMDKLDETID